MRQVVISLIVLLGTWTGAAAQDQTPSVQAPAGQSKNAVELAIEDVRKRGETVILGCLDDCEDSAENPNKDEVTTKIIALPKPPFPPIARAARVTGVVNVQVLIDLEGKVTAVAPLDGHPLLLGACVNAARHSRFEPTLFEGKPVMVTGVIRYTFVNE